MQEVYTWMLNELLGQRPVTLKVPSPQGGCVRVAVETNPEWYRELCENNKVVRRRYPKLRTVIRRCDVLRGLVLLADGQKIETAYAERIKEVARKYRDIIAERNTNYEQDELLEF